MPTRYSSVFKETFQHLQEKQRDENTSQIQTLGTIALVPTLTSELPQETFIKTYSALQRVAQNIGDYFMGNDSKRGQIARDIRRDHHLIIQKIKAEEYTLIVGSPSYQLSLFSARSPLKLVIQCLKDLESIPSGKFLLYRYNLRIFNSVKELLTLLSKNFARVSFVTDNRQHSFTATQTKLQEMRAKLRLHVQHFEEKETMIAGQMTACNHDTGQIVIRHQRGEQLIYIADPDFAHTSFQTLVYYEIRCRRLLYTLSNDQPITVYSVPHLSAIQKTHSL